ncbi:DUF885 domain-containing protein [Sphingomonas radiodurans]|uniref:DUF885 domain-containing protein n=1 Tax=Sphingomonas radiodurans TaxID=2890321 RepID=UPI001E56BCB2|nr:DUF885 domain-containing protein [Sphingomonas radiodurans]WBH15744.1 DUF885 domain-containing protein [Sphingomonas radiodurans]
MSATIPTLAIARTPAAPPAAPATGEGEKLRRIFAESDEASLRRGPLRAIFRGDLRYADRLEPFLTEAYEEGERQALVDNLRALGTVDRAKLSAVDRIAYDVFKADNERDLRGFAPEIRRIGDVLPINHFQGFQTFYPEFASGQGAAPFKTTLDYDNNLKRNAEYGRVVDRMIARAREGMARGITPPKLVVRNVIEQLDNLLGAPLEKSLFYAPVVTFPDAVPAADRTRLTQAYTVQVRDVLNPAHRRLRDFLQTEYLPKARDTVGLSALPGGAALYDYLIESSTTLPMKAEEVHALGLSEVKRILAEMEAQKGRAGFAGTLPEFFTLLRTDPRFQPKTAEEVAAGYQAIGKRVDARVREQFALTPKTPLEIRPVPAFREKSDAAGSYQQGTPDGTRPGVFYYNTYDLKNRYLWGMETLYLHEAVPGHHFQISLAQENASLPAFMRFGGNTAFVEGWALYAESLYPELGVETDPYQRMGGLSDEMLRAMRLVVDTGIHAKGWGRDQAIKYMLDNSPMPESDATAEVERYIAIPGQALAYKIGQLTILRLKAQAKAQLGARFDPRAFHAAVLDTGALPMPVLERKLADWMAGQK